MSSTVEDRLVAALEARADLVASDDLRPLTVPDSRAHPRRRTVIVLSAAAAAVVAIAAPFVIARLDGARSGTEPTRPPSTVPEPSPPTTTYSSERVLADVHADARQRADIDGDGQLDDVRLMLGTWPNGDPGGFVAVTLASGDVGSATVPGLAAGYYVSLMPAFDINQDGREQVLVSMSGGDEAHLDVYVWLGDGLIRARNDSKVPLALGLDGQGKYADYYRSDRGLVSWTRGDPVDPGGWPDFHVDQWSWSIDGDLLIATPTGGGCVDVTAHDPPSPCR